MFRVYLPSGKQPRLLEERRANGPTLLPAEAKEMRASGVGERALQCLL